MRRRFFVTRKHATAEAPANSPPVASAVVITGTSQLISAVPETGSVLTGSYTYSDADSDAEGTSTFRWLRDNSAIDGATSLTYTPVAADVGHALKFEVTPKQADATAGTAVASSATANVCTCYYVDTAAEDDDGAGTSPATAWETITKVNASSFSVNDRIRFKSGGTWTGTRVVLPSSGSSGNHIIMGAYGTGNKPVIDGNGTTSAFFANAQTYFTVDGLNFTRGSSVCVLLGTNNFVFKNCEVSYGGAANIQVSGAAATRHHITIYNNTVHHAATYGIYVGYDLGAGCDTGEIYNNTCHTNGTNAAADHGIYVRATSNMSVHDNLCYDNKSAGVKHNDAGSNVLIYNNTCYGNAVGITNSGTGVKVYNNLLFSNTSYGANFLGGGTNVYFYHNTLVNNTAFGMWFLDGSAISGAAIKNNIIFQDGNIVGTSTHRPCYLAEMDDLTNNVFDNNLIYYANGSTTAVATCASPLGAKTWAQWQTGGGDPNGVNDDPDLSNLYPSENSPCRNAGADLTAVVPTDKDGVERDATPDIGAYEYV